MLHDITLEVKAGEVLCLLGDNGAGKSTLIKIMSGVHQPIIRRDRDGRRRRSACRHPAPAPEKGIATVHQFGGTFPLMTIGRSFFVGVEPTKGWGPFKVYDRKTANEIAVKAVQDFGITRIDDGDRLVGGLSGGERQSLAIARAVHFGARVLILDEPTAALGVKQATHVLRIVNEAKRRGLAVIFITHQVMHAMAVGDHFAVLIRGAVAADFSKGEKTREEITDLMAGGAAWRLWKPRSKATWPAMMATRRPPRTSLPSVRTRSRCRPCPGLIPLGRGLNNGKTPCPTGSAPAPLTTSNPTT